MVVPPGGVVSVFVCQLCEAVVEARPLALFYWAAIIMQ